MNKTDKIPHSHRSNSLAGRGGHIKNHSLLGGVLEADTYGGENQAVQWFRVLELG